MSVGWLEFNKYDFVGHNERFGTLFAHVINLKVPKDAHRAKFLAHFWPSYPCHLLRRCDSQIKIVRSKVSHQKCQINKIIVANLFIGEIAADIVYIKKLNLQELDLSTQHDNEPPSDIFDVGDVVPFPRFLWFSDFWDLDAHYTAGKKAKN